MSTKHMTLLLWYGETAGVKVNRRYDIDSNDKFKDFFGARRTIEEGVWKQTDGKVLVGSKAYTRMGFDAKVLLANSNAVVNSKELLKVPRQEGKIRAFRKIYGSCKTCTAGVCTQRCVK